jgi:hypothetical protein
MQKHARLEFTWKQIELLEEHHIDASDLVFIPDKNAWVSEYGDIVFIDTPIKEQNTFIQFLGAEDEAKLLCAYQGMSVWDNVDEDRLYQYTHTPNN